MTTPATFADVELVVAIATTGSIGAAASRLHVSQPSASQRLAVLERRVGVALVERDTTGARLTAAGELFADHGRRALELLDEAVAQARSPHGLRLRVGTIGSLAPAVFPALQAVIPHYQIEHTTNHGWQLVQAVADGSMDSAVIGIDASRAPARGVRRTKLGVDPIVLVGAAADLERRAVRRRLHDQTVAVATYAHDYPLVAARLSRLGARTVDAASTATALVLARQQGWLAAVPRTTVVALAGDAEIAKIRVGLEVPIWLVSRGPRSDVLVDSRDALGRAMGLR